MALRFTTETMWEVYQKIQPLLDQKLITFEVINPDIGRSAFNGEIRIVNEIEYRYRSHKAWMDFAECINYRYLTPKIKDDLFIEICYESLNNDNSWHTHDNSLESKYGTNSLFSQINKLEEPCFLLDYITCLQRCNIQKDMRILGLGVNTGREFRAFESICSPKLLNTLRFLGIDVVESSIKQAQMEFPQNYMWMVGDINNWDEWDIGKFDVLIAIGVFQSPSIEGKNIIIPLLKKFLHSTSKIILGFPNSRYIDGEVKFGAKSKNYQKPEWSLLLKDIGYYRRALFRQGFQVTVTGKYYIFVTGTR